MGRVAPKVGEEEVDLAGAALAHFPEGCQAAGQRGRELVPLADERPPRVRLFPHLSASLLLFSRPVGSIQISIICLQV